ncbi:MAG: ammonia-forming cytochrome c nitrite reductase subunit c552, partial [Deltaproteobacteria bacterium]|nr:ammonia-forming cytochrome c nitrite reductase subunit c552 [Deltaproteobacteria bacterium]
EVTERVTKRTQSGACLHCHASIIPTYRRVGLESMGRPAGAAELADGFQWEAVMEGFRIMSTMDYNAGHAELLKTPDGTPHERKPLFPGGTPKSGSDTGNVEAHSQQGGEAHPVSCIDCHDPQSLAIRVTRPGFMKGIAALAESGAQVPHIPSIDRWRSGSRTNPYDPNVDASRQEMRTFVCAQCHVEYYCASKETLLFPWGKGVKADEIYEYWNEHRFPDGSEFHDYKHGETGAPLFKAQHPEFELWSQGIHARSGVACADCHMPYERQGAMKVSSHWVRSPLLNINRSCQTCHNVPESELEERVRTIQKRTSDMIELAAAAMTEMLDAVRGAQAAGLDDSSLQPVVELQRQAMWRLDFISSENSLGFHADQEALRVLGESIDFSRRAQAKALQLMAPESSPLPAPSGEVYGVTPKGKAPIPGK